eukprot:GILI01010978.1.p1 GENE.GILI01010978.1~~GILI01010978.1.p1  ORF type:complete len:511 (+),score=82.39 GILI01010978.1:186-1718(+)
MTLGDRFAALSRVIPFVEAVQNSFSAIDALETGVHVSVTSNVNEGLAACATEVIAKVKQYLESENAKVLTNRHGSPIKCARVPITPVAIIAPWNVPCGTIMPKLFAALMCGCNVILKPSERASSSIIKLVEAMQGSGELPDGVLQLLTGGRDVGADLVSNTGVAAVQFTGAGPTAAAIRSELSSGLRPLLAECGGSNSIIVADDADLVHAAAAVVQGMTALNGQWCMGISRILVAKKVRAAFQKVLETAFRQRVVLAPSDAPVEDVAAYLHEANIKEFGPGNLLRSAPEDATNTSDSPLAVTQPANSSIVSGITEELSIVGPMAYKEHTERLQRIISESEGGVVQLGRVFPGVVPVSAGHPSPNASSFLSPCLIVDGNLEMLSKTELFGPAAAIFEFESIEEAVAMTNKADGQLCCYLFTNQTQRAYDEHCIQIHSGMVMINSISFGFEMPDGEEGPMGDFVGMAGSGADGNAEALARFFTSTRWFGLNTARLAASPTTCTTSGANFALQ